MNSQPATRSETSVCQCAKSALNAWSPRPIPSPRPPRASPSSASTSAEVLVGGGVRRWARELRARRRRRGHPHHGVRARVGAARRWQGGAAPRLFRSVQRRHQRQAAARPGLGRSGAARARRGQLVRAAPGAGRAGPDPHPEAGAGAGAARRRGAARLRKLAEARFDELDEAPEFISTAISPGCSTSTRRGSAGGSPSWAVVHPRAGDFGVGSDTADPRLPRGRPDRGCRRRAGRPHRDSAGPAGLYSRAGLVLTLLSPPAAKVLRSR